MTTSSGNTLRPFSAFLEAVSKATNETQTREAFVALAATGFDDSQFATDLALAAEYQVRFRKAGILRRGAVDSFFGNLVIEFEYDLRKTRDHALEQLQNYVAGAWTEDKSAARPYLAVASDGQRWEVFAARVRDRSLPITAENVILEPAESWGSGGKDDSDSLRQFLNRLFFRKTLLKPTAANFARDFGLGSPAFLRARTELTKKLAELSSDPQLLVFRKAWSESLQISYGSVETDDQLFAKHTYLAVLARLLVWTAFERRPLESAELEDVIGGIYFQGRQIANLVEDDFFHWYTIPSATALGPTWIAAARHLAGYDLAAVAEDILKPLYEDLVDPETRHVLGEYYTPDWLASLVVNAVLRGWSWDKGTPHVLDPACGSGTFLRIVIDTARNRRATTAAAELLDEIVSRVMGIDVHPLAVIISRATYLLAIKDLLVAATRPVTLPVFLSNSLRVSPLKTQRSFEREEIILEIDGTPYPIPSELVNHGADYDAAIEDVINVAREYGRPGAQLSEAKASLKAVVGNRLQAYDSGGSLVDTLSSMATHIADLERKRRDTVYGFLLKNQYRPAMLRHRFDYVVGNPPWLTVGAISTPAYKDLVIRLATEFKITSRSAGEQSHTELATIFLAQAASMFLRPWENNGQTLRLAFVMPRSILTATHHRFLREGVHNAVFEVRELWDLKGVTPLFNTLACVVLASSSHPRPHEPIRGLVLAGTLPGKDVPLSVANEHLTTTKVTFELAFLGKRSSWRVRQGEKSEKFAATTSNYYVSRFRQGAILYPQTLIVVKAAGSVSRSVSSVRVRTDPDAVVSAKKLLKTAVNQIVETASLYFTAAADHILPYAHLETLWIALLPTLKDPGQKGFAPVNADALRRAGRLKTARWLDWAEAEWSRVRKKGDKTSLHDRLDYLGQLSAQAEQRRYLTIYTAAGARPVACVIDREKLDLPFVARDRTFWSSFESAEEAYYVAAMLNSNYAAAQITDWMNRGLFGLRDINKRILDVPWPAFSKKDDLHVELARLASKLSDEAQKVAGALQEKSAGRQRARVRQAIAGESSSRAEQLVVAISKA